MDRRQFGALVLAAGWVRQSAAKTNWKLATGYRSASFHTVNLMTMASEADAATRGELHIEIHPNNTLVKLNDMRTYKPPPARSAARVGAQAGDVPMVDVGQALAEGRIDNMITSAVTGVENRVWSHVRYYYEVNAWFPKNIVFANAAAVKALTPSARDALITASGAAEARGWAASEAAAS